MLLMDRPYPLLLTTQSRAHLSICACWSLGSLPAVSFWPWEQCWHLEIWGVLGTWELLLSSGWGCCGGQECRSFLISHMYPSSQRDQAPVICSDKSLDNALFPYIFPFFVSYSHPLTCTAKSTTDSWILDHGSASRRPQTKRTTLCINTHPWIWSRHLWTVLLLSSKAMMLFPAFWDPWHWWRDNQGGHLGQYKSLGWSETQCSVKDTAQIIKRQTTGREEIFSKCVSGNSYWNSKQNRQRTLEI